MDPLRICQIFYGDYYGVKILYISSLRQILNHGRRNRTVLVNTRFNGLQPYTCLNPMIMVKLTAKVQKNMFERAKNRKNSRGMSPDP